jgi:hypothetical protein
VTHGQSLRITTACSVVFIAACGAGSTRPPSSRPLGASTTPSSTPVNSGPLIVTWDGSTVSLLTSAGLVIAHAPASPPWPGIESDVVVGRDAVFFLYGTTIAGARIQRLDRDGTVTTVAALPPIPAQVDGNKPDFSFAVSPDESQIAIGGLTAVSQQTNQSTAEPQTYTSELWVSTHESSPVSVLQQTVPDGGLLPFAWTQANGIYAAQVPWGIGGAGPFLDYSAVDPVTIDPSAWEATPVGACQLSDAGAVNALTGSTACLRGGTSGGSFAVTVAGTTRVVATGGHPYLGTFRVDDTGTHFAFAFCDGMFGETDVTCGVTIVDLASGESTTLNTGTVTSTTRGSSTAAVIGWLPDGDPVITDITGVESVAPDGTLQTLIPDPSLQVVGILG